MNIDNKHAPPDEDDDLDGVSHAADEPTAVWDEHALRAAGLTDLLSKRPSDPPPAPATPAARQGDDPSIVVDQSIVANQAQSANDPGTRQFPRPEAAVPASGTLGWGATLAIAVALGAVVYLLIRFLKG